MIKHIVLWKLKDQIEGTSKIENALKIITQLEDLKNHIPEIVQIEAGRNFNSSEVAYDVALYSTFVSKEDLEKYQQHPDHVKVASFINSVVDERVVVDYEILPPSKSIARTPKLARACSSCLQLVVVFHSDLTFSK